MKKILLVAITIVFFACQKELSIEGLGTNNKPPIANAGIDQVITVPVDSVLLDGSSSTDPDGFISEWSWTKISGPSSYKIVHPNAMKTMLYNLTTGIYRFELKVTDNLDAVAKDTIQIVVNNPAQSNQPPIANAGTDQTITLPLNVVNISGAGSTDPDDNITQWRWTKTSGPASFQIVNPDAMQTSVINLVEGIYQFELKVTDAGGLIDKDTMIVIINPQQNFTNVIFYFSDPTNTIPCNASTFTNPFPTLITVTINNTSGILSGVWCSTTEPSCPISNDYSAEFGNYFDFDLPPGNYNWSAVSSIIDISSYPGVTPEFRQFFSTSHSTTGILTVNPVDNCTVVKIKF